MRCFCGNELAMAFLPGRLSQSALSAQVVPAARPDEAACFLYHHCAAFAGAAVVVAVEGGSLRPSTITVFCCKRVSGDGYKFVQTCLFKLTNSDLICNERRGREDEHIRQFSQIGVSGRPISECSSQKLDDLEYYWPFAVHELRHAHLAQNMDLSQCLAAQNTGFIANCDISQQK